MGRSRKDAPTQYSVGHYRDVFSEGKEFISLDSDPEALRRSTKLSRLLGEHQSELRKPWNEGEGEVRQETLEAVDEIAQHAFALEKQAFDAHGNANASDYERWAKRLQEDLDTVTLRTYDWSDKTREELSEAREGAATVSRLVGKVAQKLGRLQSAMETTDPEDGESAYNRARDYRKELDRMVDCLDDDDLTGPLTSSD